MAKRITNLNLVTNKKYQSMKSKMIISGFIALMMSSAALNAQTWQIGYPVASNVTATLSGGTLTISGTGAMQNFNYGSAPWYSVRTQNTSVKIEQGVTSIGNCAFYNCTSLTSVAISGSVTSIGDCAFLACSGLPSVTIPSSVTSIGDDAFQSCIRLISVDFNAKNCTTMGSWSSPVFEGCSALSNLNIGNNVISIPAYAFCNCSGLTSVAIPSSVTSIGNGTFGYCSGLTSVTIPSSVTSIGDGAFESCSLTSVIIPSSVSSIGVWAFLSCPLTAINVDAGNLNYSSEIGVLFDKNKTLLIQYPAKKAGAYEIPNSVTSIGTYAFYDCFYLTSVTIPNSVISIGDGAFQSCWSLTSVTIPNSVTSIGANAFYECELRYVIMSYSVTSIGNDAFYDCPLTSITIPSSVTSIGANAFENCRLTAITCLNPTPSIITMGSSVFSGVDNNACVLYVPVGTVLAYKAAPQWRDFTNIQEPQTWQIGSPNAVDLTATFDGNTLTISGRGAMQDFDTVNAPWYDMKSLVKSLVIDRGVTHIGTYAFGECSYITGEVVIPGSVTSIGDAAFAYCYYGLTSVTIPSSVTSISYNTFFDCISLTGINVDADNPTYSSDEGVLFNKNKSALICFPAGKSGDYVIPNSVTSIGAEAFLACGLVSVTIPASILSIGDVAFGYCSDLTSITCFNPIPSAITLGDGIFYEVSNNACTLYVPGGSIFAYQSAPQWQDFNHITGVSLGIENEAIQNLKLYPNPVKDVLNIIAESLITKVEIYNIDGKMMMQENNFVREMNVSSLLRGVYVARVYTAHGVATVKIIKD